MPHAAAERGNTSHAAAVPEVNVVRAFVGMVEAIGDDAGLDVLLHRVARRMMELIGASRCSVYLLDRPTGTFHGRIAEPKTDANGEIRRLRAGTDADAFTREIVATKRPVVVHDASQDPRPVRSAMRRWRVRSMLGVPLILREEVIGVMYLDEPDTVRRFSAEAQQTAAAFATLASVVIDQTARAEEMKASVQALETKTDLLLRSTAIDERLTSLLVDSSGLADIAAAVTQLSRKPCVIWDSERRPLAGGCPGSAEPTRAADGAGLRASADLDAALSTLQPGRPGLIGPYLPTLPNRLLAAHVRIRAEVWGYVALSESGGRFTAVDAATVRRAAMVVAAELAAERRAVRGEADARQVLMRDVLRGEEYGDAHFESRAELLGFHVRRGHLVCLLKSRSRGSHLPKAEIAAALGRSGVDWFPEMTVSDDGTIALLAEIEERQSAAAAVAATKAALDTVIEAIGNEESVLVAVSSACGSVAAIGRGHDEARQVLRCLERLTHELPGSLALTADDLGPARLLLTTADLTQAGREARDTLSGLLTGDNGAPSALLPTLDLYFAHQRNMKTVATLLDVHPNTVRYRLGRVAEITSLNVVIDPDDQMKVHMALIILRLTGRLPARRAASGQSYFISLK